MNKKEYFRGMRILVTGASGTVGQGLIQELLRFDIEELKAFDNNESGIFYLGRKYGMDQRVNVFVGDVRDLNSIARVMEGVDIVFHGAALKHVLVCERSPFEAVQTNIIGVENVITAALGRGVKKVVFMSSDKAVNPTNVMGTSKLMGERLMTAANSMRTTPEPIFTSTRFGNILGSRGSVLPLFISQVKRGENITLTDRRMTRFVMSASQAVDFVLQTAMVAKGGEVFVTKMPVIRIEDLAQVIIDRFSGVPQGANRNIGIDVIGPQAGEKLYEELLSEEEANRSIELKSCFCVLPAFRSLYGHMDYSYEGEIVSDRVAHSYRSDREVPMTPEELSIFLDSERIVENVRSMEAE